MILFWDSSPTSVEAYRFALGAQAQSVDSAALALRALHENAAADQLVVGPAVPLEMAIALGEEVRLERPEVGVILIRHRLDVTTLSEALRAGFREVVSADDQSALVEALRRSRELTARMLGTATGGTRFGKVITVFSAKGGVGKTTLSTNVGAALARAGRRTLLIDLDLAFGDVAISLQLTPSRTISEARGMMGHFDSEGLSSLITHHQDSGLDVLCAPQDPGEADRTPSTLIAEIIRVARAGYEYVIVDTPPSFTEHVLIAVDVSDLLVLIATLDIPALKNLRVALDTLDALGSPKDNRVIVLNRSDAKVGLNVDDVVAAVRSPISVQIPGSISVPAAVNRGVPIVLDEPKHPVSHAISELVDREIRVRFGEELSEAPRRRGLFRSRS